jgi:hypothetical protein
VRAPRKTTPALETYDRVCRDARVDRCPDLGQVQDASTLVALLVRSCNLGNVYGCFNLGYMYDTGQGVARDAFKAGSSYRRAEALEKMMQDDKPPAIRSVGTVLVRPQGEIGRCIELSMARHRVAPPPGGGEAWIASGVTISK